MMDEQVRIWKEAIVTYKVCSLSIMLAWLTKSWKSLGIVAGKPVFDRSGLLVKTNIDRYRQSYMIQDRYVNTHKDDPTECHSVKHICNFGLSVVDETSVFAH
jgi:hypothetical protein